MLLKKKWHPANKRLEYIDTFSISKWNHLPNTSKEYHSFANCNACYSLHLSLQQAYPDKPIYVPEMVANLPPLNTERDQARKILAHLNPIWETRFSHSLIDSIPKVVPECNLVRKTHK